MARVARITAHGGPEVIAWESVELPSPGLGQVTMRNTVVGLNFIDTYHRSGLYPMALPSGLGVEAAGVIEALGEGVSGFAIGDRVCTMGPKPGTYASAHNIAAASLFPIPDDIADEVAAAAILKGCTTEALVERCARVEAGWPVLVHASAGGVGLILVQWLKHAGAIVIGVVSSAEKAEAATAVGADHIIRSDRQDIAKCARELTGGEGVRVVFDGTGAATWEASLDSTRPRGMVVSFGNASGPVIGVAMSTLATKGSLFVTRMGAYHYYADPAERRAGSARVFEMIRSGAVTINIGQRYALEDAAQAHRDLEARRTTGSTLLLP